MQYGLSTWLLLVSISAMAVLSVSPPVRAAAEPLELKTLAVEETVFLTAKPLKQGMRIEGIGIVIDLRYPYEGVYDELGMLKQKGIKAVNIPISSRGPSAENLHNLVRTLESADTQNVLIHDSNGHRTAMLWAAYRLKQGLTMEEAVKEVETLYDADSLRPDLERISHRLAGVSLEE